MATFVNSCFCGLVTLKTGAISIITLYWSWSIALLITDSKLATPPFPNRSWIGLSSAISSTSGLHGTRWGKPAYMVPEVLMEAVNFILYLANLITFVITTKLLMPNIELSAWIYAVPGYNVENATYGIFFVVVTIINLVFRFYFLLVVISYAQKLWCREIQEERSNVSTSTRPTAATSATSTRRTP